MKAKLTRTRRLVGYSWKSEVKLKGDKEELIELLNDALMLVKAGDPNLNARVDK